MRKQKIVLEKLPKVASHYCRSSAECPYIEPLYKTLTELLKAYKDYCSSSHIPPILKPGLLRNFSQLICLYTTQERISVMFPHSMKQEH